jgi:hypothetical protein
MTELDTLIERARGASVDRAEAERYVRELDRWAQPVPRPRRWVPWLAPAVAVLAFVVVLLHLAQNSGLPPPAQRLPVLIGDRVAIVAAPGTAYRVVRADRDSSEIAVERGTITARLWRGAQPHRLVLAGGGVTATATGTVYSLTVGAAEPVVSIAEGRVEVRTADGAHDVSAGASWPPGAPAADPAAVEILLAIPQPATTAAAPATPPVDAGAGPSDTEPAEATPEAVSESDARATSEESGDAASAPTHTAQRPASRPVKDRWRSARLLRAQGRFADALAECLAIADAHDPMWSPIALVEAVRIDLGPLAAPERAIALVDRMLEEWPEHALVSEARALRCRALGQLGRDAECTGVPPP